MAYIALTSISKSYSDSHQPPLAVLDSITAHIAQGQFVAILGPNGCGKTTLLQILAGLLPADSGTVLINGHPPAQSRIGLMLQNYRASLFPWLRNLDNIAFVLDRSFGRLSDKREYVHEFVRQMGLADLPLSQYPYQCSGGQQQLVALARELAYRPEVLLLDEPFAALDYERRTQQQQYLLQMWERAPIAVVVVSHDIDDAIYLADRVLLLSHRPAVVATTIDIPLPRPRRVEIQASPEYAEVRASVLKEFLEILQG